MQKFLKTNYRLKKLQITNVKYKSFAVPSRQLLRLRALHWRILWGFNAIIQLFCRHNILEIYTTTGLSYFLWLAILYFLFFLMCLGVQQFREPGFNKSL